MGSKKNPQTLTDGCMRRYRWLTLPLLGCALIAIFIVSFQAPKDALTEEKANFNEKPIVVVIPSYNNKQWYQKNLDSVLTQNYHNFRIIFIDDASPDGT